MYSLTEKSEATQR